MILTDFHFPEALERDVTRAAFQCCDKARSLSGAKLFKFLPADGTASVGVQVSLRFYATGDYRSAGFELAPAPDAQSTNSFHVFVPFSQGYSMAVEELINSTYHHWVSSAASQFIECHGRALGAHDSKELEAMAGKARSLALRWAHGAMDRNECLCAEIAGREIKARKKDSSHSRMKAIAEARAFAAQRKVEDEAALNWWHNLPPADRSQLPEYSDRDLPEALRALFSYRKYLSHRSGSGVR